MINQKVISVLCSKANLKFEFDQTFRPPRSEKRRRGAIYAATLSTSQCPHILNAMLTPLNYCV